MIERAHLEIVRSLAEHGTLTAAAEALFTSQSALSHAMKRLETASGTSLWQREGRNLRLTQAGEHLLQVANEVLPYLEATEALLKSYGEGKRGKLRIGMECHPCYEWLLSVLAPFMRAWPKVDVDVRQRFQFGGLEALRHHEIDLLVTPDPVYDEHLQAEPVLDFEMLLVVSAGHALANQGVVHARDFRSLDLLVYPVPRERLDVFTRLLIPAGVAPRSVQTVEATEIMLQMTAFNRGACTLPDWLFQKYKNRLKLKGLHLGKKEVHKQLFLMTRKTDGQVDYLNSFIHKSKAAKL